MRRRRWIVLILLLLVGAGLGASRVAQGTGDIWQLLGGLARSPGEAATVGSAGQEAHGATLDRTTVSAAATPRAKAPSGAATPDAASTQEWLSFWRGQIGASPNNEPANFGADRLTCNSNTAGPDMDRRNEQAFPSWYRADPDSKAANKPPPDRLPDGAKEPPVQVSADTLALQRVYLSRAAEIESTYTGAELEKQKARTKAEIFAEPTPRSRGAH